MQENIPEILTIPALQQGYKQGDFTPAEVLNAIAARARETADNPIWITAPGEAVYGKYLAALPPMDFAAYPLWGIPFAIKDNIDLAGVPTTAACPAYAYTPKESATVVQKLIAAGAIPVGKTNLDQFATGLVGTRSPYGEVHNAWQPELISGGSSSGSAVSVALGQAAFALGTDTAGSGRVPAMLNTLVGYKPPVGSWSTCGVVPACASLDCVTVFAHTLAEAEAVDAVARGVDEACAWSRTIPLQKEQLPAVILLPAEEPTFYGDWAAGYRRKWQHAVARLRTLGLPVREVSTAEFSAAARLLYDGAYVAERWADIGPFVESHPGATFPVTEKILRSGGRPELTAARLFEDLHQLALYRRHAATLLGNAVLVLPTAGGTFTRAEVAADPVATNSQMGLYTNHCNLLELAAVAIPENSRDHEYPAGLTLFSLAANEHLIRATARAFLATEEESL